MLDLRLPKVSIPTEELEQTERNDLLSALGDPECRRILHLTRAQSMTAAELSAALGISLSSIYRKLQLLSDSSVLSESLRLSNGGHHLTQYRCRVDCVHITIGEEPDGSGLLVTLAPNPVSEVDETQGVTNDD